EDCIVSMVWDSYGCAIARRRYVAAKTGSLLAENLLMSSLRICSLCEELVQKAQLTSIANYSDSSERFVPMWSQLLESAPLSHAGAVKQLPSRCRERPLWRSLGQLTTHFKWSCHSTGNGTAPVPYENLIFS